MTAEQERVEAELVDLAEVIEDLQVRLEQAYTQRLVRWVRGRRIGMTQGRLAAPSRVTEGAVTQALRKYRLRQGNGAETR